MPMASFGGLSQNCKIREVRLWSLSTLGGWRAQVRLGGGRLLGGPGQDVQDGLCLYRGEAFAFVAVGDADVVDDLRWLRHAGTLPLRDTVGEYLIERCKPCGVIAGSFLTRC